MKLLINAKWSIFVGPGAHRPGSPPVARTQTPPPTAFLMLSKLRPKTFPALIVENGSRRWHGLIHKAEFSLRHSPWHHVPSSRDCWSLALISRRAARHRGNAGAHRSVPNTFYPLPHLKCMTGGLLSDTSDLGVRISGWKRRAFIFLFLPYVSVKKTKDWEDGRGGRITFQQTRGSYSAFRKTSPRGVPPLPLTHNAKFICNFVLFCHIKLHWGEVSCFRGIEIIAITGEKK